MAAFTNPQLLSLTVRAIRQPREIKYGENNSKSAHIVKCVELDPETLVKIAGRAIDITVSDKIAKTIALNVAYDVDARLHVAGTTGYYDDNGNAVIHNSDSVSAISFSRVSPVAASTKTISDVIAEDVEDVVAEEIES